MNEPLNGTPNGESLVIDSSMRGISSEEQVGIHAEIEAAFRGQRGGIDANRLEYTPVRRGSLSLLLLNIGAIVVTAAGILVLFAVFQRDERLLIRPPADSAPAQARLFEQFRSDAGQELALREREIERVRAELSRLAGQNPGNLRDAATVQRIAELEAELAGAESQREVLIREVDSAQTMAILQRLQQQEQLLSAQLSVALERIGELEARPMPSAPEPSIIRELPAEQVKELSLLRDTVAQLQAEIDRLRSEGDSIAAERALLSARANQLSGERDRIQAAVTRLERDVAGRVAVDQQRSALRGRLSSLTTAVNDARTAPEPGRSEVLDAVESRIEVLSILTTEPVRSRHPGLDVELERYLDTLVTESRREGRVAGLREALGLIERVGGASAGAIDLADRFSPSEQSVVRQMLTELDTLLR